MILFWFFVKYFFSYNYFTNCDVPSIKVPEVSDSDLIQVHVMMRHGARTPLHYSKNFPNNETKCDYTQISSVGDTKVNNAVRINVKNGKSVSSGNCVYGQLIKRGHNQLKRIGADFRKKLVGSDKFLEPDFNPKHVKIRSTHTFRTFHSVTALLIGMFPKSFAQMKIRFGDKLLDVWKKSNAFCPKIQDVFNRVFNEYMEMEENKEQTEEINRISKIVGMSWIHVNDFFSSSKCDAGGYSKILSDRHFDKVNKYKTNQMLSVYANNYIIRSYQALFLAQVYNDMVERINGKSSYKLELWSAHDGNIIAAIAFLGVPIDFWPPYASHLTLFLYDNPIKSDPFIIISFNGREVNCSLFNKVRVPLHEFYEVIAKNINDDFLDLCLYDNESYVKNQLHIFN